MKVDKRLISSAQKAKKEFYLTIFTGFIGGVFIVLQSWYLSKVLDLAFLKKTPLSQLWTTIALLSALILGRALMSWLSEGFAGRMAAKVKFYLRNRLYDHIARLGPIHATSEKTGELTNTTIAGIEELDAYFSQYIPQLAITAMIPLTILAFVFPIDTISGVVMLLTAPVIPVIMMLIGYIAERKTKKQWTTLSRMSAHFLDVLQGLKLLKIFGRSREQLKTIAEISERFREATMGVLRIAFISALALELLATLSTAVIAVEIGLRLLYGYIDFRLAFFVLVLAPEFYLPFRQLGLRFHAGMSGVAAADRIFQILNTPVEERTADKPADIQDIESIKFNNVSFAYEQGDRPAIRDVSLTIEKGLKIALVGPTGSGKSTVATLLLRFISPDSGQILVNGIDLSDIDKQKWLSLVAWVPQSPYLFNGTVEENVKLSRPDATREQVIEVLRQANAYEFVQQLPQGLETIIGERGSRLSGGQAQRIAIARALLKDAPFIILDEATSNLDPEIEAKVQKGIENLMKNRTVLIIAHRLSTVQNADKIIVLKNGSVIEQGSHSELMQLDGFYAQLVKNYSQKIEQWQ